MVKNDSKRSKRPKKAKNDSKRSKRPKKVKKAKMVKTQNIVTTKFKTSTHVLNSYPLGTG
jgi:hypothetical protein